MLKTLICRSAFCFAGWVLFVQPALAATESVLYSFPAGASAKGKLFEDNSGAFYGTTYSQDGLGTVYQLKESRGSWDSRVIQDFHDSDGANPFAGVIQDPQTGTFYGTTVNGGAYGGGTVFSIQHDKSGWSENVLRHLSGSDGQFPKAALTRDKATGVLYGTASSGGESGCGTAFQVDPATGEFDVLYSFQGASDGCRPTVQLRATAKAGILIGATERGGSHDRGTIFLLQQAGGVWTEKLLHTFAGGADGKAPSDLTVVSDNNIIYGVASGGGTHGDGLVFQLAQKGHRWTYSRISSFTGRSDGGRPLGLHLDNTTGALYGVAEVGGDGGGGVLFQLNQIGTHWQKSILHAFGRNQDGAFPISRPAFDVTTGVLYGTTLSGGTKNGGVVYAVSP
ncbi:MAG: hypothetical protein JO208_05835 [Alphaproteobacteria bacterium]|nr:hypothetical protein [Alphaproteobacteria bacterium]